MTAALVLVTANAYAQPPFYQGKTITIISGASGGYDTYAHLLATHMKKYIAGTPTLIARSMPGAGSLVAANYLYNVSPPDGLTFGGFTRTIPLAPLMGNKTAKYEAEKFTWIGSSSRYLDDAYLMMLNKSLRIAALDQLHGRREPLRFGSTGPSSQTDEGPRVLRDVIHLNIQIIRGYQTTPQIMLAVERGEVDGIMIGLSSLSSLKPEWLAPDGPVNFLVQVGYGGEGRHPTFPNVPRIDEFAKTADDKAIFDLMQLPFKVSRPFAGPPNMPSDLTRILRNAFMQTHDDPQYLADAKKMGLDVSAMSGEEVASIVAQAAAIPAELRRRYADILAKSD